MITGRPLRDLIGRLEHQAREDRRRRALEQGTPAWLLTLAPGMGGSPLPVDIANRQIEANPWR